MIYDKSYIQSSSKSQLIVHCQKTSNEMVHSFFRMPNIRVKHRNIVIQDPVSAIAKIIVYDFTMVY